MSLRKLAMGLALALLTVGCADTSEEGGGELLEGTAPTDRDSQPGGLYHDFIKQGKYDAAGHPRDAEVFEGGGGCSPATGVVGKKEIGAKAGRDEAGIVCKGTTESLGDGTFTLNTRAMLAPQKGAPPAEDAAILEIAVFEDGEETASRTLTATDFGEPGTLRDLAATFRHRGDGGVRFEVRWTGEASVRFSYAEVFRASERLVVSPASGVLDLDGEPTFEIEMRDAPDDLSFEVTCDDVDLTDTLASLIEDGEATREATEFRTIVSAPAPRLFDGCELPSTVTVHAMSDGWTRETSRVTYLGDPIPCQFATSGGKPGGTKVLVTGFEPFPADSRNDNSSQAAVEAYADEPPSENVAVMPAVLPVEYDTAPDLIAGLVDRCDPDVVIGFGQGRTAVDVEQIAYNRKDTAAIAGGIPDNRGVVYGGAPIVEGGPAERQTELPVDTILSDLDQLEIDARPSEDPGRYVCNNTFYGIMQIVAPDPATTGGFVHLPRIPDVGESERETLRQTVATVVEETVAVHGGSR